VESITLNFSKQIRADRSVIRIYNDFGTDMAKGDLTINGLAVSAPVSSLPPGSTVYNGVRAVPVLTQTSKEHIILRLKPAPA